MARAATAATHATPRRSARNLKRQASTLIAADNTKQADITPPPTPPPPPPTKRARKSSSSPLSPANTKTPTPASSSPSSLLSSSSPSPSKKARPTKKKSTPLDKAAALQAKKLSSYPSSPQSPFPDFPDPTPSACRLAHKILASLHGDRPEPSPPSVTTTTTTTTRPSKPSKPAGSASTRSQEAATCGSSPSVLTALVHTILSQNTTTRNSAAAYRGITALYKKLASDHHHHDENHHDQDDSNFWSVIAAAGQPALQSAIQPGGLSAVKSRVITDILTQLRTRHPSSSSSSHNNNNNSRSPYSLNHLFAQPSDQACTRELLSFRGVGPKTASCVLMFCLGRRSFAVDTHVHRLSGLLGWQPPRATREQAQAHLDARIPGEEKHALHVLLIAHGKACPECRAGGRYLGGCELRRAFGVKGGGGETEEDEEDEGEGDDDGRVKEEVDAVKEEIRDAEENEVNAIKQEAQ
ncbi:hypothetical protein N3K66_007946 [Trichothecium roseum]|uniref:Uncharacterized protein n=1 Tax=Trichothecium roseum TaxID=47278 RepID=A0ACC0UTT8_9HYPO|nr:hypothetical protein N3K66_007946 [Trichothecium roseum]